MSIKNHPYLLNFLFFFISCFYVNIYAQFNLYSDFYIASAAPLHITVLFTPFTVGKFVTHQDLDRGVISSASKSSWQVADHNAHIDGNIKVYNLTTFTFPTGYETVFLPGTISQVNAISFINIDFLHQSQSNLSFSSGILETQSSFDLNINQLAGIVEAALSLNSFSNFDTFLEGLSLGDLSLVGYTNDVWVLLPSSLSTTQINSLSTNVIGSYTSISLSNYDILVFSERGIAVPNGTLAYRSLVVEAVPPTVEKRDGYDLIQPIKTFSFSS